MEGTDTINLAIALNREVVYPAAVLLRSVAVNHTEQKVCVYVLHSKLTKQDFEVLDDALNYRGKHELIDMHIDSSRFEGLPWNRFWTVEAYYRLLLPEMLSDTLERILYLDVDMVVNKNLSEFYFRDLGDCDMVVSRDALFYDILAKGENHERNRFFEELAENGLVYFCSGMLLMNLAKLKDKYTFEYYMQIFGQMLKDNHIYLPDQDLLNFVHYKNVLYADETVYGLFADAAHDNGMTYEWVKEKAVIVHFTGQAKPWTVNLVRYDIEKLWWEYASTLPFYSALMERVFYMSMESDFTERHIKELLDENKRLRELVAKCSDMIKRLS